MSGLCVAIVLNARRCPQVVPGLEHMFAHPELAADQIGFFAAWVFVEARVRAFIHPHEQCCAFLRMLAQRAELHARRDRAPCVVLAWLKQRRHTKNMAAASSLEKRIVFIIS